MYRIRHGVHGLVVAACGGPSGLPPPDLAGWQVRSARETAASFPFPSPTPYDLPRVQSCSVSRVEARRLCVLHFLRAALHLDHPRRKRGREWTTAARRLILTSTLARSLAAIPVQTEDCWRHRASGSARLPNLLNHPHFPAAVTHPHPYPHPHPDRMPYSTLSSTSLRHSTRTARPWRTTTR